MRSSEAKLTTNSIGMYFLLKHSPAPDSTIDVYYGEPTTITITVSLMVGELPVVSRTLREKCKLIVEAEYRNSQHSSPVSSERNSPLHLAQQYSSTSSERNSPLPLGRDSSVSNERNSPVHLARDSSVSSERNSPLLLAQQYSSTSSERNSPLPLGRDSSVSNERNSPVHLARDSSTSSERNSPLPLARDSSSASSARNSPLPASFHAAKDYWTLSPVVKLVESCELSWEITLNNVCHDYMSNGLVVRARLSGDVSTGDEEAMYWRSSSYDSDY